MQKGTMIVTNMYTNTKHIHIAVIQNNDITLEHIIKGYMYGKIFNFKIFLFFNILHKKHHQFN